MNLISDLSDYLIKEKIISSQDMDNVSISLVVGEAPKRPEMLSRCFLVSKNHKPFLSVKFIPNSWRFSFEDILKTRSLYSSFKSVKVPHLLGHFFTTQGHYFIEEYIQSASTLAELVEKGDLNDTQATEIVKNILLEIWTAAEPAREDFVRQEMSNFRNYLKELIEESFLYEILIEYVEKSIYQNLNSLRYAWSTGDILDRNILLSGGHWYLVDYEYCHQTLFLFKEAYRNILFAKWAQNRTLREICPWLGDIPEEVAILVSFAWEKRICSEALDIQANRSRQRYLRELLWNLLYPDVNRLLTMEQHQKHTIEQLQIKVQDLQHEINSIHSSPGCRLLRKYIRVRDLFIPLKLKQRRIYNLILKLLNVHV